METTGTPQGGERNVLLESRFEIRVCFLSDWHVGSGTGQPGHIDRLVVRDADELPYLPSKTITGIWRDACERLADALDAGQQQRGWSRCVELLFGSQPAIQTEEVVSAPPLPAALSIRPGRLPATLRRKLHQKTARSLRDAITFIKPGVAIDHRSGLAKDKHLRLEEMSRTGAVLVAPCSLDFRAIPQNLHRPCSALLVAGTKLVERLGGKRRRGAGRCRLEVIGHGNVEPAVRYLTEHQAFSATSVDRSGDTSVPVFPLKADEEWKRVDLVLTLEEPLAVMGRTVGNVVESLDFLPGTYLPASCDESDWLSRF